MVSPCDCRGSGEFIHAQCLTEYLRHYPDGICRVCRRTMLSAHEYEILLQILLYMWLCFLITLANVPLTTKGMYMAMMTPVFLRSTVLSIKSMMVVSAISFILFCLQATELIHTIIGIAIVGALATLTFYIPPQYLIMFATIGLSALYACILTIFIATTTDLYMRSFFGGFITIVWLVLVNLRPPFPAIN